jgi:broad specificity phosphatase PhoE
MPRETGILQPETKEQFVQSYIIDCRRHGEKEEGEEVGKKPLLSKKGKKQARAISTLKPPYLTGDTYVSQVPRTRQTAEGMKETEWQAAREIIGQKDNRIVETKRLGDYEFWENPEFMKNFFRVKTESSPAAAHQWYLDFKDNKPYGEVISPEEAAASYGSVIVDLTDELEGDNIKNKSGKIPKTIISHDLVMEPFLYYAIGDQIENDKSLPEGSFIDKIGGPTENISGFTVRLDREGGVTKVTITLNGKDYAIDLDKLKALINKYKAGWENESTDQQ